MNQAVCRELQTLPLILGRGFEQSEMAMRHSPQITRRGGYSPEPCKEKIVLRTIDMVRIEDV